MNEVAIVDIGREAMWVVLKIAGPIMLLGLVSGLVVALFQALTTIQEMTLTFVPKIVVIFIAIVVFLPFMMNTLLSFAHELFDRISVIT